MNPSPFTQHLGTNYSPSEEEVLEIKDVIQDHARAANAVAEEIEMLDRSLSIKRDIYAAHNKSIEEHRALLSPIRRIPSDILSTIFLEYLPDQAISWRHPAVIATHVSRAWRQLALNLTAWWSAVKFHIIEVQFYGNADISPEWVRRVRMVTRLFKIWTERSGQSPLKLTIEILGRNEYGVREGHGSISRARLVQLIVPGCMFPRASIGEPSSMTTV